MSNDPTKIMDAVTLTGLTANDKFVIVSNTDVANGKLRLITANAINNTAILTKILYPNTIPIANLPSAVSFPGARAVVNDANSSSISFNTTVVSGGSAIVPVFSDGSSWKYG